MQQKSYTLLASLLLLCSLICQGQTVVSPMGVEQFEPIGACLAYLEDKQDALSIKDVLLMQDQFVQHHKKVFARQGSNSAYWFRFTAANNLEEDLWLEVGNPFVTYIDFYSPDSLGQYGEPHRTGVMQAATPKFYNITNAVWLPLNKKGDNLPKTYYLRIKSNTTFDAPLHVGTIRSFMENKSLNDMLAAGFSGLVLVMIIFNSYLYWTTKEKIYGLYVGYLTYGIAVTLFLEGYLIQNSFTHSTFFFWHTGVYLFVGLFCIHYLKLMKWAPRWGKFMLYFSIFMTIAPGLGILLGFTSPEVFNGFQLFMFVFYASCILSGVYLMKMEHNRLYLLGWTCMVLGLFVFLLTVNGVIPYNPFTRHAIYFGAGLEIIVFSFALSNRMNAERRQKELLQEENMRIISGQKQELERKVQERTEELNAQKEELATTLEIVEKERQKSDKLLLNILPAQTAEELKERGYTAPKIHEHVTVLFTDFKGFTESVTDMKHDQLINDLDYCFRKFDKIIQRNGLEKIKTIGDAYMAASGLPAPNEKHAENAVRAALEIMAFVKRWKKRQEAYGFTGWDVRIGLHSGPVIAGVVGSHKFAYDIWGDTVNTAARMESSGMPGRVNISDATYRELVPSSGESSVGRPTMEPLMGPSSGEYHFEYRGEVEAKGKGKIGMWFVEAASKK